ncbi:MAG: hypothetical protein N2258_02925 [Brevinematales bacterium]|nr:hypothetical protein [Brevinematales bacterium]
MINRKLRKMKYFVLIISLFFFSCENKQEKPLDSKDYQSDISNSIIYVKDSATMNIVKNVYVKNKFVIKDISEALSIDNAWVIYITSSNIIKINNKKYILYTWSEINNPKSETYYENYHYGKLIILDNHNKVYALTDTLGKIHYVIPNSRYFTVYEIFETHGEEFGNFYIYKFENNKIQKVKVFEEVLYSNLGTIGTKYIFSEFIYTNLNNDKITDIIINKYSNQIIDYEKTDNSFLIGSEKVILNE